jgi:DNA-directed RNA polymerase specialized sigma24 family protein
MFEAHQGAVFGYVWRMTGSPAAAEDIAQVCFVTLLDILEEEVVVWIAAVQ